MDSVHEESDNLIKYICMEWRDRWL